MSIELKFIKNYTKVKLSIISISEIKFLSLLAIRFRDWSREN